MCVSHFTRFFSVSCHISRPTMWVSPFPLLSVFSPYSRSTNVCVSFNKFFGVSCHISCPTMSVSPFPRSQCSRHIPGPTVCNFHFSIFSLFLPYSRSFSVLSHFPRFSLFSLKSSNYSLNFSIFHLFHCFLPHIRYYSVRFSYCTFFSDICHNSCPSMWFSHFLNLSVFWPFSRTYNVSFSFSLLGSFIGIFQVLQWAFSFFNFFSVSRNIPGHLVFVSHFPRFSIFSPKSSSYVVYFS